MERLNHIGETAAMQSKLEITLTVNLPLKVRNGLSEGSDGNCPVNQNAVWDRESESFGRPGSKTGSCPGRPYLRFEPESFAARPVKLPRRKSFCPLRICVRA